MTTPADQISCEISSLQSRLSFLQDSVRLKNTLSAVQNLQTVIDNMPQRLTKLRTEGYVFEKVLETQAGDFSGQWKNLYPALTAQINSQTSNLESNLTTIEEKMTQLAGASTNPSFALPLISSIKNEIEMLENKASSAESTVQEMYSSFNGEIDVFDKHLDDLEFTMAQLAEAKFTLLPTEAGLRAVKAVWCKEGKARDDDPKGILYLTDQRLLFEQKEEVATKKVLFITTAKQKVQELKWETPVGSVDQITPYKEGVLKNEDHLDISFMDGASIESAHLHIWGKGNDWLQFINRAKTKDFDNDRTVPIDQNEIARLKSAPSQCPGCGANLNQVILRGQDSIKCEFCGFVIRL